MLSAFRNSADIAPSSPERSSAAKSGTCSSSGASTVSPSPRADRVERDIAQGGKQMRLVHRHATKAPLPEMPGAPLSRMDAASINAEHLRQPAAQRVGVVGRQNQMDMVGHKRPRPHRHPVCGDALDYLQW